MIIRRSSAQFFGVQIEKGLGNVSFFRGVTPSPVTERTARWSVVVSRLRLNMGQESNPPCACLAEAMLLLTKKKVFAECHQPYPIIISNNLIGSRAISLRKEYFRGVIRGGDGIGCRANKSAQCLLNGGVLPPQPSVLPPSLRK